MSIQIATDKNYKELISEGFTIVDFYSTTCVPCKIFSRVLEDLTFDYPFVNIVKVNTTDYPMLGVENEIEAVPTVFFVKDGEVLERAVGVLTPEEVTEKITEYYYG